MQADRCPWSTASLSRRRVSAHSARVAHTRRVASLLPTIVCFSQIFSLGSLAGFACVCSAKRGDDKAMQPQAANEVKIALKCIIFRPMINLRLKPTSQLGQQF